MIKISEVGLRKKRHVGYRMADGGRKDMADVGCRMEGEKTLRMADIGFRKKTFRTEDCRFKKRMIGLLLLEE